MRYRNDLVITAFCDKSFIGRSTRMKNHLGNLHINPNTQKLWSYNQIIGNWDINNDINKLWIYTKTRPMGQYFSQTTSKVVGQLLREAIEQDIEYGFYNDETQMCFPKNYNFGNKKEKVKTTKVPKKWFKDNDENCSICLCNHEYNIISTPCGHKFHKKCFKQFLTSTPSNTIKLCPLCKQDLVNVGVVSEPLSHEGEEDIQFENNIQNFLQHYMIENNLTELTIDMGDNNEVSIITDNGNEIQVPSTPLNIEELPDIDISDIEEL